MLENDVSAVCVENKQMEKIANAIPFDKLYPRNIWVDKRQAVYERIDTLHVSTEVKKAMKDAATSVIEICAWCMRERLPFKAILRLADKKCLQIIEAESEKEVEGALNMIHMSRDTG